MEILYNVTLCVENDKRTFKNIYAGTKFHFCEKPVFATFGVAWSATRWPKKIFGPTMFFSTLDMYNISVLGRMNRKLTFDRGNPGY